MDTSQPPPPPPPPQAGQSVSATPTPSAAPSTDASSASSSTPFPRLRVLPPPTTQKHTFIAPTKRINTGADLTHFLSSLAYRDLCTFILQLNRALCPRKETTTTPAPSLPPGPGPGTGPGPKDDSNNSSNNTAGATQGKPRLLRREKVVTFPLDAPRDDPPAVTGLRSLLAQAEAIILEAPPDAGPRRFGNAAFRRWHGILESHADALLREHLPREVWETWEGDGGGGGGGDGSGGGKGPGLMDELKAYFLGGFGSPQRLDYGTGHELSFLAFLGALWKVGVFGGSEEDDGKPSGEVERSVVLGVFEP